MKIQTNIIRKKRLSLGIKLKTLGIKAGYPEKNAATNMSHVESGRAGFSLNVAQKIANAIGISISELIQHCISENDTP